MQRKKPVQSAPAASVASSTPTPQGVSIFDVSILNFFFPIFFSLLIPRFLAANRAPISDCDETFNFWEAVHHLTFSGGQQTWEHAPQYALRSWLYAGVHAVLFRVAGTFVPWMSSPASFWFMSRFALAALSAAAEALAASIFLRQCRKMHKIDGSGNHMVYGYLAVAFLATSPGMFSHQISLLPTTTAATLLLLCTSLSVFDDKYFALVPLLSGVAILLAWPFACVAYAPIIVSTLHHYHRSHLGLKRVIYRAVFAAVTIVAASSAVDSVMYAPYSRPPPCVFHSFAHVWPLDLLPVEPHLLQRVRRRWRQFNHVRQAPPPLYFCNIVCRYGTEPWYWYLMNGFVNLGIIWPFVLVAPLGKHTEPPFVR
jgi:hypothetical protein